jgi:predicted nuclease of predicted toxin-antitoxin system
MNFLVDAHLPPAICRILKAAGHDAVHTCDLPAGNATTDAEINRISSVEQRIVISKDADFFYSHTLHGQPWKLILVRTGNLNRAELTAIFERHLSSIEAALADNTLIELNRHLVQSPPKRRRNK